MNWTEATAADYNFTESFADFVDSVKTFQDGMAGALKQMADTLTALQKHQTGVSERAMYLAQKKVDAMIRQEQRATRRSAARTVAFRG